MEADHEKAGGAVVAAGLLAAVLTGCEQKAADGTVTVVLTGAAAQDGEGFLFAVFAAGADIAVADPLGLGGPVIISGGTASGVALDVATGTQTVSFDGGDKYDVYVLVDLNGNFDMDPGEPVASRTGLEVDGDMTVTFDYATLTPAP